MINSSGPKILGVTADMHKNNFKVNDGEEIELEDDSQEVSSAKLEVWMRLKTFFQTDSRERHQRPVKIDFPTC